MIRRPPRSTLFPYTTLSDLSSPRTVLRTGPTISSKALPPAPEAPRRSEEHTSELQSPCNLVCRLLLEKKKQRPTMQKHLYHIHVLVLLLLYWLLIVRVLLR